MVQDVKPNGNFLINCQWTDEELDKHMPAVSKNILPITISNFTQSMQLIKLLK